MADDFLKRGFQYHKPGVGHVGSYQVSGIPWVSSSLAVPASSSNLAVNFSHLTKHLTIRNDGVEPLRFAFSTAGMDNGRYFWLPSSGSYTGDLRVADVYLSSRTGSPTSASIIAGLTGIERNSLRNNWSGSSPNFTEFKDNL